MKKTLVGFRRLAPIWPHTKTLPLSGSDSKKKEGHLIGRRRGRRIFSRQKHVKNRPGVNEKTVVFTILGVDIIPRAKKGRFLGKKGHFPQRLLPNVVGKNTCFRGGRFSTFCDFWKVCFL